MRHPDGTYACDRCSTDLPGFGALFGLVASGVDPADEAMHEWIFCYANGCAAAVLDGLVSHTDEGLCTRCGDPTPRIPVLAVLTTDVPDADLPARMLTFCRANDCAGMLLDRGDPA